MLLFKFKRSNFDKTKKKNNFTVRLGTTRVFLNTSKIPDVKDL